MKKKEKILIIFLVVLLFLVLYLLLTSESVKNKTNVIQPAKVEKIAMSDEKYMAETKIIFNTFEKSLADNNLTAEQTAELKNQLLALKGFSAKFKEPHLKFVLALDEMENYLSQKDEQKKSDSFQAINQLKADYSWLNY